MSTITATGANIYTRAGTREPLARISAAATAATDAINSVPKGVRLDPWDKAPTHDGYGVVLDLGVQDFGYWWFCTPRSRGSVEGEILNALMPKDLLDLTEEIEAWSLTVQQEAMRRIAAEQVAYEALLAEQAPYLAALSAGTEE